jgi:hypothetical protein
MARKTEIVVRLDAGQLVPVGGFDRMSLREIPDGSLFFLEPFKDLKKKVRLFHVLLGLVADNAFDDFVTKDQIKGRVFQETGLIRGTLIDPDGTRTELRMSTNELSSEQLDTAIERLLLLAELEYCPGIDIETLKREAKDGSSPTKR